MNCSRIEPEPGQESVWNYPRPPKLEDSERRIKVVFGGVTLTYTRHARRILETSHPPVYYVPREDVRMEHLTLVEGTAFCEWKGRARYYDIETDERREPRAAWFYPDPVSAYRDLKDHIAFYPALMDTCWVDRKKVRAQAWGFYGGWITSDIVVPFKGGPGSWSW